LSRALPTLESLKNLVPQTLGKTRFDFVTFLAEAGQAEFGALCSIPKLGLKPSIRRMRRVGLLSEYK
jgi:hypothetical protein